MLFQTFKEIQATLVWLETHNPSKVDEFCLMMQLERIKEDISITFSKPIRKNTIRFTGSIELEMDRQSCIREANRLKREYADEMLNYMYNSLVFFDGDEAHPGIMDGLDATELYYSTQNGNRIA